MSDRLLRRKLTLRAHGQQVVFVKKPQERLEHVLMKAFLWALYLPRYPALSVEVKIGDRYKPDVVQLDERGQPLFWGEAGKVGVDKIEALTKRYRNTHFAMGKWATRLDPYAEIVEAAVSDRQRTAPFDLLRFPADSAERFITDNGEVTLTHDNVEWIQIGSFQI